MAAFLLRVFCHLSTCERHRNSGPRPGRDPLGFQAESVVKLALYAKRLVDLSVPRTAREGAANFFEWQHGAYATLPETWRKPPRRAAESGGNWVSIDEKNSLRSAEPAANSPVDRLAYGSRSPGPRLAGMPSKGWRLIFKSTTQFHVGKSGQRFVKVSTLSSKKRSSTRSP